MSHSLTFNDENRQDEYVGRNFVPSVTATVVCECGKCYQARGHNRYEALYAAIHKRGKCRRGHVSHDRAIRDMAANIERVLRAEGRW